MIQGKTVLAVIPARGGSKRVPRKNIRLFRGKPLIQWTIEAAQDSGYLDRIIVSTEDGEIAQISKELCCPVLIRPWELAEDDSKSEDVVRHALKTYPSDIVVLLQPTSPLRTARDIDACIEIAAVKKACISYSEGGKKNGAVYAATQEWMLAYDFDHPTTKYFMPEDRSLDIDRPDQFD